MGKIILSGHIEVPLDELEMVRDALNLHIELTRAEPGCLVFNVEEDAETPGRFTVYEEFVDQAAFDQHQARGAASAWAEASRNVARHYEVREA